MADLNLVKPYVSNIDQDVFLLRGLPEEISAVLFAYYSRSPRSLRENLAKLLTEDDFIGGLGGGNEGAFRKVNDSAKAFHEKYTVGYGHKSVAEHARVRIAIEKCSILAAKAIEDARLGSYTEKSTRYVQFTEDSFYRGDLFPDELNKLYLKTARTLMRTYTDLTQRAAAILKKRAPMSTDKQCQTKAFDLVRGVLPAGTLTSLGVTLNATVAEYHFSKLLADPLIEVQRLAAKMNEEARTEIPTLLKYVEPATGRQAALEAIRALDKNRWPDPNVHEKVPLRKLEGPTEPLWKLATMILLEARPEMEYAEARFRTFQGSDARQIIEAYLKNRGAHESVGRPFEHLTWTFELVCDYGAWRDLQRHRMISQTTPLLTCTEDYMIDPLMAELGIYQDMQDALKAVQPVWRKLADHDPRAAQYIVPLAYNIRYQIRANLRELFHIIELRSKREGHPAYRAVAQALASEILYDCPFLGPYLRVDKNHYDFARS